MDHTPAFSPPYYAVIFVSQRSPQPEDGYLEMAAAMMDRAPQMPGFLGVDTVHDRRGHGITVSYWQDEDSIRGWRQDTEHALARKKGRAQFYASFALHVAKVERAYDFEASSSTSHDERSRR